MKVSGQQGAPASFTPWKEPQCPFNRRMGGPHSWSRRFGRETVAIQTDLFELPHLSDKTSNIDLFVIVNTKKSLIFDFLGGLWALFKQTDICLCPGGLSAIAIAMKASNTACFMQQVCYFTFKTISRQNLEFLQSFLYHSLSSARVSPTSDVCTNTRSVLLMS
jgi:hypothetical protein